MIIFRNGLDRDDEHISKFFDINNDTKMVKSSKLLHILTLLNNYNKRDPFIKLLQQINVMAKYIFIL